MGWTAETTVQTANSTAAVLVATGDEITSDGDDKVSAVSVSVSGDCSHLAVGAKITVTADC